MNGKIDSLAVVAGSVMAVGGFVLLIVALFGIWPLAIHGLVLLIVGIVILLTLRQQERVEPIKTERNKSGGRHRK
jgi:hypothetical protein